MSAPGAEIGKHLSPSEDVLLRGVLEKRVVRQHEVLVTIRFTVHGAHIAFPSSCCCFLHPLLPYSSHSHALTWLDPLARSASFTT